MFHPTSITQDKFIGLTPWYGISFISEAVIIADFVVTP